MRLRTAVVGTGFVGPFHVDAVRRGGYADVVAIAGSDPDRTAARASIRLIHGGYVQDWLAGPQDYNWRLEPEISGASRAVADIGSHWFDTAEHVSGLRVESVFADLATFIPLRRRPAGGSVAFGSGDGSGEMVEVRSEDAATILVRFEGGARGACVISQVSPGRKNAFGLELAGSDRTLEWHQEDPEHLWVRDREESRLLTRVPADAGGIRGPSQAHAEWPGVPSLPSGHPEGWAEALRDMLRPFYAAVASGQPPPDPTAEAPYPTVDDGARGLAFVEAVMASARTERWVPVASAS